MTNEIVVILGRKGSGKTYLAKQIIRTKPRALIFDPVCQFSDVGVIINDPLALIQYLKARGAGPFRAVYQPITGPLETDITATEFRNICEIVWCLNDVWFLVDEIDTYAKANYCPPFFNNLVQRGRHKQISVMVTTRRHTETTRHITAQADTIITFRQHEPADIKYLGTFFGSEADKLPTLPPFHFLKYCDGIITPGGPNGNLST